MAVTSLVSALALLLFAQAAPPKTPHRGARIAWARGAGAEACVGALGLAEDIKARLGWDPFVLPKDLDFEGTITKTRDGHRADLWIRDAAGKTIGRRTLVSRAPDCRTLGETVATTITVAIDPDVSGEAVPGLEDTSFSPEVSPSPAPAPVPSATTRTEHVRVTAGAGITAGLVPGPSDVSGLRANLVIGDVLELGLGMSYFREAREGAFGFALTTGELRACVDPWGARHLARFCGAVLAGAFAANLRSTELVPVELGTFPWLGAEIGPVLSIQVAGPVRAEVAASILIPLIRRQGFVRGAEPTAVYEQARVGGRAELGLGVLF